MINISLNKTKIQHQNIYFSKNNNHFLKLRDDVVEKWGAKGDECSVFARLEYHVNSLSNYRRLSSDGYRNFPLNCNLKDLAEKSWPGVSAETGRNRVERALNGLVERGLLISDEENENKVYFFTKQAADMLADHTGKFFPAPLDYFDQVCGIIADNLMKEGKATPEKAQKKAATQLHCFLHTRFHPLLETFAMRFKQDKKDWYCYTFTLNDEVTLQHKAFYGNEDREEIRDRARRSFTRSLASMQKFGLLTYEQDYKGGYTVTLSEELIKFIESVLKKSKAKYQETVIRNKKEQAQNKMFGTAEKASSVAESYASSPFRT